ncbi:MAG: DUF4330 domain-containing protein, partial [Eubacteriales bacterium]
IGGVVLWQNLSVDSVSRTATTIRYVIRMDEMQEGTGAMVKEGSTLVDVIKNYPMGTIVSAEIVPAVKQIQNDIERRLDNVLVEGYEDVYATIECQATHNETQIVLDGGMEIRVGNDVYLRGEGYMAAGYIVDIERIGG